MIGTTGRRYQAGVRSDFPPGVSPGEYFVLTHRAHGVVYEELSDDEQREYRAEKKRYVRTCTALIQSRRKQEALRRAEAVAVSWAQAEARAGRQVWGVRVPVAVMQANGLATSAPRPREAGSRRTSGGGSASRGGDSGDPPREPCPDLARLRSGASAWALG